MLSMKKPLLISLALLTAFTQSTQANQAKQEYAENANLARQQSQWRQNQQTAELKRLQQRATFLQFENLLKSALKNQRVAANKPIFLQLLHALEGYPLQQDAWAAYFDAQIKQITPNTSRDETIALKNELEAYINEHPSHFLHARLQQNILTLLNNADAPELVDYAKKIKPQSLAIQVAALNMEYRLTEQSQDNAQSNQTRQNEILQRFGALWLANGELTDDAPLWAQWNASGSRTADNIIQKAQNLFAQNDLKGLQRLAKESERAGNTQEDSGISADLQRLVNLLKNPANLKALADKSPLSENDYTRYQFAVVQGFNRYLYSMPENIDEPNFTPYEQWAQTWRLSDAQIRDWKIAFLNRFFDNPSQNFQHWRDVEILKLAADNLIERRLRMAIWQKTDLQPWLNALSQEGKAKQEWRYWLAKTNKSKTHEMLSALAKERGFYPMLAATTLTRNELAPQHRIEAASFADKNAQNEIADKYRAALLEIDELRQLDRLGAAKQRWRFLLENLPPENKQAMQIALSEYANQQNWFDLGVDGSIIAQAKENIALRLPNAYSDYFDIALNTPTHARSISKTFAMAIARQESAWNPMAQSSANARGLMQLLPSTAQVTADNNQLPYQSEQDLFKPLNNILLGTAHLNELNTKYPDNRILIAAAYNAGASRVEKWLARADGKLAMDEFIASIPFFETRGYVQNVLTYDFYYQLLQRKENPQTFSKAEFDRLY